MWVLDVEADSTSLHLVQGEWSLGRSGNVLNFPKDKSISRSHAEFQVGGLKELENVNELPSFELLDKKSRFGTFLNDVQISPNTPMQLRPGDKVSFGAKTTVLRVRYLKMVARTSRIQKNNRKKLIDGCKSIGMHIVNSAIDDINYCITDPGKFVATEKILWALVHNHPIVTSEWIQAILHRKSLSEELPSCEAFLPAQESTDEKSPSYKPDPRRFSLYSKYLVVFLAPSSMEALIPVMGGVVYNGYKSPGVETDDILIEDLRRSSKKVLIVYPSNAGEAPQSEKQSMSKPHSSIGGRELDPAVTRRLYRFQESNYTIVLHQELAASVIFTTTPQCLSNDSVSQLLGVHAPLPPQDSEPRSYSFNTSAPIVESAPVVLKPHNTETPTPTTYDAEVSIPVKRPRLSTLSGRNYAQLASTELVDETPVSVPKLSESMSDTIFPSLPPISRERNEILPDPVPVRVEEIVTHEVESPADPEPVAATSQWMSKPKKQRRTTLSSTTSNEPNEQLVQVQITTSCLIVRRPVLDEDTTIRYLTRHDAPPSGLKNAKRFRKSHRVTGRRMITRFIDEIPLNQDQRRDFEKQREAFQAREQLAEALFENNMVQTKSRPKTRKL